MSSALICRHQWLNLDSTQSITNHRQLNKLNFVNSLQNFHYFLALKKAVKEPLMLNKQRMHQWYRSKLNSNTMHSKVGMMGPQPQRLLLLEKWRSGDQCHHLSMLQMPYQLRQVEGKFCHRCHHHVQRKKVFHLTIDYYATAKNLCSSNSGARKSSQTGYFLETFSYIPIYICMTQWTFCTDSKNICPSQCNAKITLIHSI